MGVQVDMTHLPGLIFDLGFLLIVAAIVTLVFKKLKQPVVLGYLIAGFLASPHVPLIPTVRDMESLRHWAEIGVIFLLFSLGLEFSFKKLFRVGKSASIAALFEILFMLGVGFVTGRFLGWSNMDSLFLGGILSVSSTTIIYRAFEELGLKGRRFVSLVFGVLIVEDLVAILLMVLLTTVAVTQTLSGRELFASAIQLGFFMVLWFLLGLYFLPIFFRRIHHLLSDETVVVISVGLCLLMVIIATELGFSPALGAFVMGSLLAETREAHRITQLIFPVRDLFAAVFFVSVGMLIDPNVLIQYWPEVLLITGVTIVGKLLGTGIGALVAGESLRHSVQAGMSLAQIGEFSFIIATLGLTLNVTSEFLYPIAVSVSAVTTFATPYLIRSSDSAYQWLERHLSGLLLDRLSRYQRAVARETSGEPLIPLLWRAFGWRTILNSVMVVGIGLGLRKGVYPQLIAHFDRPPAWLAALLALTGLLLAAPFLWAIVLGYPSRRLTTAEIGRLRALGVGLIVVRALIGVALLVFLVNLFAPISSVIGLAIVAAMAFLVSSRRFAAPIYHYVEERLLDNLDDQRRNHLHSNNGNNQDRPLLAPWDASLVEFVVSPNATIVGSTLAEARIKERFGVTVALIERGHERILAPGRDHLIMPMDRLFVIGSDDQLSQARSLIEDSREYEQEPGAFGLESILLSENSRYLGRSIRDSGLREDINGLIVGLERGGHRLLSPDSSIALQAGDLIWVVGELEKIKKIRTTPT